MHYTVRQFADIFHTTEHTIRYYTDIGLLPCQRDEGNRRVFDEESVNWMQGIVCLKGCGASIEDIKEYCRLCRLEENEKNLRARYQIFLKQREAAYQRLKEAETTVEYMEHKIKHDEDILAGTIPDDSNPVKWTENNRPERHEK